MIDFDSITIEVVRRAPEPRIDPHWEDKAACRNCQDPDRFFIPELMDSAIAEYCNNCPVTAECYLTGEMVAGQVELRFGVWGGVKPESFRRRHAV